MTGKRLLSSLLLLGFMCIAGQPARAENTSGEWAVSAKLTWLMAAHTSYEFGNPEPPKWSPLSRLEFPLNSWWGGLAVGRRTSRWAVNLEVLTNLSREAQGAMKDTDWEDENSTKTVTTYSESDCRLEPSYMAQADFALQVGDWLGLPRRLGLAPLVGIRYQNFHFVTHDGVQWSPPDGGRDLGDPLPGDGISFRQTYWHFFLGFRSTLDLKPTAGLTSLQLSLQADWAYVVAENRDHHLLRAGHRLTLEETKGDAWRLALGIKAGLGKHWFLSLDASYLNVYTTGSHRLLDDAMDIDFSFSDGVVVWSEQVSLTLGLTYAF